jgi:hypothetical protein
MVGCCGVMAVAVLANNAGCLEILRSFDPPKQNRHTATMQDADHVTLLGIARGKTNIAVLVFEELPVEHYSLNPLQELSCKRVGAVVDHLRYL